ncbi:unnamed protein product [Cuscuta europaea]|uniref:Pectinesterase inhibitor domain-containing protein n=1 Tax=Cuscuta europaea TaxID=41803 RepID=A0A9P0Z2D3_CUSEU|nr:unnamed protein product [Cuscuta europaea]
MKSSSFALLPFCIIFATLSIVHHASSKQSATNITEAIEDACTLTRARDLCASVLISDPRSETGDIRMFGVIILEKALSKVVSESGGIPMEGVCGPKSNDHQRLVHDIMEAIKKLKYDVKPVAFAVDNMSNAIEDILRCTSASSALVRLLRIAMDILLVLP